MHQTSRWSIAEDAFRSGQPGWFVDPRHVPGGALIDEGIYAIELFSWLAGSDIVEVEARIANLVHKDLEVEDWGMATFTLANGVLATLEAAWTINAPRKTGPSPKQNAVVRLEVIGTRGEIMTQSYRDPGVAVLAAGADNWVFERQAGDPFGPASPGPIAHLIDCLEQHRQPLSTIADAHHAFAAALAAYESVRFGRSVRLEELVAR
jgi:predicted dehydrogenase